MFENTSRFRVHVDQTQRSRKSKNNKTDEEKWQEVIEQMDDDEFEFLAARVAERQKEIKEERKGGVNI